MHALLPWRGVAPAVVWDGDIVVLVGNQVRASARAAREARIQLKRVGARSYAHPRSDPLSADRGCLPPARVASPREAFVGIAVWMAAAIEWLPPHVEPCARQTVRTVTRGTMQGAPARRGPEAEAASAYNCSDTESRPCTTRTFRPHRSRAGGDWSRCWPPPASGRATRRRSSRTRRGQRAQTPRRRNR
jgi:hypothetical protein